MWASIPFLVGAALGADEPEDQYRYLAGLADRGLHDLVVAEARVFLAEHPRHARADRARFHLGESLFALERFGEAGPEFERLDRSQGFEFAVEVDFRRGQCSLEQGAADAAEPAFEAVLAAGDGYLTVPATFLLGEARLRSGEPAKASERYRQVLAAEPEGEFADDAAHGLVWCARSVDDHAATVAAAGQFLGRFADDGRASEVWLLRGEAELELGAFEEALTSYSRTRGAEHASASLRGRAFALAGLGRHAD
ncbi:MAG: tetratricopeptide repeat protein, partial [Planctomycetota bacterium]